MKMYVKYLYLKDVCRTPACRDNDKVQMRVGEIRKTVSRQFGKLFSESDGNPDSNVHIMD